VKNLSSLSFLALIALFIFSCAEDSDTATNTEKFTAIFDISVFDAAYEPMDIVQAPDGGYVVLSKRAAETSDYSAIHILKADKTGNFEKELIVVDSLVNPVSSLTLEDGKFYFICMSTSAGARIASFDEDLNNLTTSNINGLTYPSAASFLPDKTFALLGYNSEDKETLITVSNLSGELTKPVQGFSTGVGGGEIIIDKIMIEHYLHNGKHYPFSVGRVLPSGKFYFNGFVEYNFSMLFTDFTENDDLPPMVFGENDDGGFSAIANLGPSDFAIARFHFGDNYFSPREFVSTTENSVADLAAYKPFPEITSNANIRILLTDINARNVTIYGSDTKSKQIGLYFYDQASAQFLSSRYLGFSNPYEFSSMTRTADGGLAVCGTTYLAGRFPRICIFKLSEDDLNDQTGE
jgi:hypothetical protein